ncbi:Ribbon-helix-helix protein CopG domain-containing protein [Gammaproteobacteria bacterium]
MINVQLAIDEKLLAEVDKISEQLGLDLTQIIREALVAWLKKREALCFEQEWITALKNNPDTVNHTEDWLEAQVWSVP